MVESNVEVMYKLPKMLTIRESAKNISAIIGNDNISEWFIRNLCKTGAVKCYMTGNKCIVNFDDLVEYLGGKKVYCELEPPIC